jgi:hypothetical protein
LIVAYSDTVRRANHIAELESNITSLRGEHASLQSAFSALQQREAHLESWIRDLESAIFRHGLSGEVHAIRRAYSALSSSTPTGERGTKRPRTSTSDPSAGVGAGARDPLNTLAQAALAPEHTRDREAPLLPPIVSHWDKPSSRHSDPESEKKRRDSVDTPSSVFPSTFWKSSIQAENEQSSHYGTATGHSHAYDPLHDRLHERVAGFGAGIRAYERTLPAKTICQGDHAGDSIYLGGCGRIQREPAMAIHIRRSVSFPLLRPGSSSSHFTPPEWAAPSPHSIQIEDLLSPMAPATASLPSHEPTRTGQ